MFHFHTTIGPHARYNTRSVRRDWFWSWLMLDFHEHATHHMYPNIPWYQVQERSTQLPEAFQEINARIPFWQAVFQQWHGPTIIRADDANPIPHLFVRWED
jgi:fatty acid desaturase